MAWKENFKSYKALYILIIINVAIFLGLVLFFIVTGFTTSKYNVSFYSLSTTALVPEIFYRPWSIVTYMFVHFGVKHFIFNIITLYLSGVIFLRSFDEKKLVSVYLIGGVVGFVFFIISYYLFPNLHVAPFAVGSSASIMAIIFAGATFAPKQKIHLYGLIEMQYWIFAAALLIYDFISINSYENTGGHIAHLGGALFGFIFAIQYKKGKDYSMWLNRLIDRIKNFKWSRPKKSKMYVEKRFVSDEEFNMRKNAIAKNVDRILDKISKSGYSSLTKKEKEFLNEHSKS